MVYVMSDIHGCYEKYVKMLEKINFSAKDTLYILGDVVDRGPKGMQVLLDIAKRENVILLRGNHDHQAAILLSALDKLYEEDFSKELIEVYKMWFSDGGKETLEEYLTLTNEEKETVLHVLIKSLISKEIEVNGKTFLLSHTVAGVDIICDYEEWDMENFLLPDPDYEEIYFDEKYVVTGHTPTYQINEAYRGRVFMQNNHIAIDCGAVFGNVLGCVCLDTLEEFYVE